MKPHSEKFLRQRRFFMVLPLLVLPFVTLLFWALGGGKGVSAEAQEKKYSGLNTSLPEAIFTEEDEDWNKFDLYEQAKRDSLKFQQARKNDPYFEVSHLKTSFDAQKTKPNGDKESGKNTHGTGLNTSLGKRKSKVDPNEAMVNEKLEELYKELDKSSTRPSVTTTKSEVELPENDSKQFGSDVDRLEEMMLAMQGSNESDPEMQQIESVLEKILDIQHPERVKNNIKEQSSQHSKQVFPVEKQPEQNDISLLAQKTSYTVETNPVQQTQNGFYGLDDEIFQDQENGNAIEAVIHDTQELMAGSTVKMRLLNDVYVKGKLIPKDQFIYGTCNINGERLTIDIESIRTDNSLLPVSLTAYDLDGLEGIYIPGAIARDVVKQSTNQAIQGMEFNSFDPSIGAQAANAGIQAAKTLLSKKAKAIKVTVKAGYKILLYDANAPS